MTCQEAIELMLDYLDAALSPPSVEELERHFAACAPCRAYLATYKKTKALAAEANRVEMPDEMKRRLRRFLLEQLRNTT
ncbi:MAG: zf-HC2 domain-containing protein [Candidatus Rokubacteria bacterium]|nr:zf-HC2 domain-containing protein [Candidatus Rokubacteria bacterium]